MVRGEEGGGREMRGLKDLCVNVLSMCLPYYFSHDVKNENAHVAGTKSKIKNAISLANFTLHDIHFEKHCHTQYSYTHTLSLFLSLSHHKYIHTFIFSMNLSSFP